MIQIISSYFSIVLLIFLMTKKNSMPSFRAWLNSISGNKIAQLMIVGWAFPFLIKGLSGFETPAAIAAPALVGGLIGLVNLY